MNVFKNTPAFTRFVLSTIASLAVLYMTMLPYVPLVHLVLPPPIAAAFAIVVLILLAVYQNSAKIQKVADDIPGLVDHTVTLAQFYADFKAAADGLAAALESNTGATATNTAAAPATPVLPPVLTATGTADPGPVPATVSPAPQPAPVVTVQVAPASVPGVDL